MTRSRPKVLYRGGCKFCSSATGLQGASRKDPPQASRKPPEKLRGLPAGLLKAPGRAQWPGDAFHAEGLVQEWPQAPLIRRKLPGSHQKGSTGLPVGLLEAPNRAQWPGDAFQAEALVPGWLQDLLIRHRPPGSLQKVSKGLPVSLLEAPGRAQWSGQVTRSRPKVSYGAGCKTEIKPSS